MGKMLEPKTLSGSDDQKVLKGNHGALKSSADDLLN